MIDLRIGNNPQIPDAMVVTISISKIQIDTESCTLLLLFYSSFVIKEVRLLE